MPYVLVLHLQSIAEAHKGLGRIVAFASVLRGAAHISNVKTLLEKEESPSLGSSQVTQRPPIQDDEWSAGPSALGIPGEMTQ